MSIVRRRLAAVDEPGDDIVRSDPRRPASDEEWVDALRREPGQTRRAVLAAGFCALDAPGPDVFHRLRLPDTIAGRLLAAIESARLELTTLADSSPWHQPWDVEHSMPSVRAARTISTRARRVPAWVGLLALLESAAMTWDDPRAIPRRPSDDVYRRAGYRCEAPGCTARADLHDHHIVFRSRGGTDETSQRVVLCQTHHLALHEDGTLAAEGREPLDVTWSKAGRRFRCEREI